MLHVLVIESDKMLGRILKDYLKAAGYSADVHADPQAALTSADQRQPNLIIAELQLAKRSGAEFLYEFRSYPDWQDIPVIIFTNLHPDQIDGYSQTLKDLGIFTCLYKTQSGLAEVVKTVQQLTPVHAEV